MEVGLGQNRSVKTSVTETVKSVGKRRKAHLGDAVIEPLEVFVSDQRTPPPGTIGQDEDVVTREDVVPAPEVSEDMESGDRAEGGTGCGCEGDLMHPLEVLDGLLQNHGEDDPSIHLSDLVPGDLTHPAGGSGAGPDARRCLSGPLHRGTGGPLPHQTAAGVGPPGTGPYLPGGL